MSRNVFRTAFILHTLLVVLATTSDWVGRILQPPENPYEALLGTPYSLVLGYPRCYPPAPEYSGYCVSDVGNGSIAFALSDGLVSYVSVSGTASGMRIGDLIAIYGQPLSVHKARFFATWVWRTNDLRIIANSRRASVWEPVRWLSLNRQVR